MHASNYRFTQVDASFTHSLLRVVPYDDCPTLPSSDDAATSSALMSSNPLSAAAAMSSSSGLATTVTAGDPARDLNGRGLRDGGGLLRGGDVVRLCHLTSTGFLTYETTPSTKSAGGIGGIGGGDAAAAAERENAVPREVRASFAVDLVGCVVVWDCAQCIRGYFIL